MKASSIFLSFAIMIMTLSCGEQGVKKNTQAGASDIKQAKLSEEFALIGQNGGKAVKSPIPTDQDKFQNSKSAAIQIFLAGETSLKISPVPFTVGYSLPIAGWTKCKILWIQVKSSGGKTHDLKFTPGWDGNFSVLYLIKDGPGAYKIMIYGANDMNAQTFQGLASFSVQSETGIPKDMSKLYLNPYIMQFVNANMGQQVGRGECWDLAQAALDLLSADWVRTTEFGMPLDPEKDEILPGDIIQFKSVKITIATKNGTKWESYGSPDHTAIVYKVLGKLHYDVAHQNVFNKKIVMVSELDLNYKTSGQVWFYRPVMGLVQN